MIAQAMIKTMNKIKKMIMKIKKIDKVSIFVYLKNYKFFKKFIKKSKK